MSKRKSEAGSNAPANDLSDQFRVESRPMSAAVLAGLRERTAAPSHRIDRATLSRVYQLIDISAAVCLVFAALSFDPRSVWPVTLFSIFAITALHANALYTISPTTPPWDRIARAVIAMGLAGVATLVYVRVFDPALMSPAALQMAVGAACFLALQIIYAFAICRWAKAGRLAANLVVVGATPTARRMIEANRRTRAVNVLGVFDDRMTRSPSRLSGIPYLGTTADLANWAKLHDVDRILITVRPDAVARVRDLLRTLKRLPQPIALLLDFENDPGEDVSLESVADAPAAQLSGSPANPDWLIIKRLEDLVIGTLMFVAALPVMAVIALLVRLDSPGPVLFRQIREGFNGRPIGVLKFRSMRHSVEGEKSGIRQVERDDPRVTRIGRILRATSLDELPQLWNVLKGEMSLVGPRPHAPGMKTGATLTSNLVAEYAHRHRVKPGLTGWAQVNGSRGPLHTPEAARERVQLDVAYIARASLWFDLWIMLRTLPALLGDKINIR